MFKKAKSKFSVMLSVLLCVGLFLGMRTPALAAGNTPLATNSTVGQLTIFSSNDDGSSSWDTAGHAFIAFKNTTSSPIRVGGLNVGSTHEITFGTWGNQDAHDGIWYNLESYFTNNQSAYGNRVSLTMSVTQSNIDTINTLIRNNDTWSLTNNCSSFSTKIWNSISLTKLSAGIPNTPTSLMASIKSKTGYQTKRAIGNTTPIGYVSNGAFVTVTVTAVSKSGENLATQNTTEGFTGFISPINMNPNSYE